jgi:hypothetical protein
LSPDLVKATTFVVSASSIGILMKSRQPPLPSGAWIRLPPSSVNLEAKRTRKSSSVMKPTNPSFFCTSSFLPVARFRR